MSTLRSSLLILALAVPLSRPAHAHDPDRLDLAASRLTRDCEGELCDVLGAVGPVGALPTGIRVGLAVPCRDPERLGGPGELLRQALEGDFSQVELAGMTFSGGRLNVFALRPEDAAERAMVEDLRDQLVACLGQPRCELEVPDEVAAALRDPQGTPRAATVDASGHVVAHREGALEWHVGRSEVGGWYVVTEHADGGVCEWLDVFPSAPVGRP